MRLMAVIIACNLLAGCQTIGNLTSMGSMPPDAVASPALAAPVVADEASAAGVKNEVALSGMSAETLRGYWGEPTLKRRDVGSELWQYGTGKGQCSVLLYFYPAPGGVLTVSHAEAVPGGPDPVAIAKCAAANQLPSLKPVS